MSLKVCMRRGWLAALALAGVALGIMCPASAQAPALPVPPQWMQDAGFYFGDPAHIITPFLTNRYLWLWEYFRGGDETKIEVWRSDAQYIFNAAGNAYAAPWGFPKIISGLNGDLAARPFGNHVLLHIDDPTATATGGFVNVEYPGTGQNRLICIYGTPTNQSGVVCIFPNANGTFAPYQLTGGTGAGAYNLLVDQYVSFARDLMRVEIRVTNQGGSTRRVGLKELLDPDVDREGGDVFFLPQNRNRILTYVNNSRD